MDPRNTSTDESQRMLNAIAHNVMGAMIGYGLYAGVKWMIRK